MVPAKSLRRLTGTKVQWLLGSTIDAFMEWVLGQVVHVSVSTQPAIYVPTWVGVSCHNSVGLQALVRSPRMSAPGYAAAISTAPKKVTIMNIEDVHWVALILIEASATVEIYDPLPCAIATAAHAQPFLSFMTALTGDEKYIHFSVQVLDSSVIPQLPFQADHSSCGIFAALYLYHYVMQARLHFTQADIPRWRQFMLCKILRLAPCPVGAGTIDLS